MRRAGHSVTLCPALQQSSALQFLVNDAAGSQAADELRSAIAAALAESGRSGTLLAAPPNALAEVARDAAARAAAEGGAIVAVGGDGTLNTVAQAAHAAGCPMGVLPRGTFNYFARSHGIATEPAQALRQLLAATPRPIRVAAVNEQLFLVNASVGLYPELLEDREAWKARFGRNRFVALGAAVATLLRAQRRLKIRIELDGMARDVRTLTLFVGHNRLQLAQIGVEGNAGAHLTAVMLRPIGTLSLLGLLWHGALGRLGEADSVERFEFDRMRVRPSRLYRARRVKVAFDGEVAWMRTPLEFHVLERPLWLIAPPSTGPAP